MGWKKAGSWSTIVRGRGYFDAQYMYDEVGLEGGDLPFDFKAFMADPTPFFIQSVRADTGETVTFTREDLRSPEDIMFFVRASSTMPGFMVMPRRDGISYVDGALGYTGGIPIQPLIDAGFSRFAVLLTRPRGFRRVPPRFPSGLRVLFRSYPAVAEAMIKRHERYNASLDTVERLAREGRAQVFYPERMLVTNRERNPEKIRENYREGERQAAAEWDSWRAFLGL